LVTSPWWVQEPSFEHLLEIARTHRRRTTRFLPNALPGSAFPSLPCLPNRTTCPLAYPYPFCKLGLLAVNDKVVTWIIKWSFGETYCNEGKGISETPTATGQSDLTATRLLGRSGASSQHNVYLY
jgi:hypothetical protein